jgi:hypothetical protein
MLGDLEQLVLSQLHRLQQQPQQAARMQAQPAAAHLVVLQVLAALPVACADKQCSVHPNRRMQVSDALAAAPHISTWVAAAFQAHEQQLPGSPLKQLFLTLGLQLVHGWCELGTLPITLPTQLDVLQHIALAAVRGDTAAAGAEALVSMVNAVKDVASQGSDLLLLLVRCWQEAMATVPLRGPNSLEGHDVLQV